MWMYLTAESTFGFLLAITEDFEKSTRSKIRSHAAFLLCSWRAELTVSRVAPSLCLALLSNALIVIICFLYISSSHFLLSLRYSFLLSFHRMLSDSPFFLEIVSCVI